MKKKSWIPLPTNCQTPWKILIKSHRGKKTRSNGRQWKTKGCHFNSLAELQIDTESPPKNGCVPGFFYFVFHFPVKDKKNQEQRNVGLDNDILSIWKVMSIKTLWDVLNLFQTKIFIDWLPIRLSSLSFFFIELSQGDSSCSTNHGRFFKNPREEGDWYINLIHVNESSFSHSSDNSYQRIKIK